MSYIELYSNEILEATSLGKSTADFDISKGDYIKIEIINSVGRIDYTLYSNRLMMKYKNIDDFYIGDYHYHQELGFLTGREPGEDYQQLIPVPSNHDITNTLNFNFEYKKQFNVYYDDNNNIYIKPPEIIKQITKESGTYRFRVHFLRDLKTSIGQFFENQKNNLIENGNFFAGLEATQAGDLDGSKGHNRFTMKQNPGLGRFVLEQNGAGDNEYNMMITGIEPSSNYIFSAWVGYSPNYEGEYNLIDFDSASTLSITDDTSVEEESGLGSYQFSLELKGKYYNGWPHCKVSFNGNLVADFYVETDEWTTYTFPVPDITGIIDQSEIVIGVTFDNDAYGGGGSGLDRNLYYKKLIGPNGKIFNINGNIHSSAEQGLLHEGNVVEDSEVAYYQLPELGGELRNTHSNSNFVGEFRTSMAWNGEVKTFIKAHELFDLNEQQTSNTNSTFGLIMNPSPTPLTTDFYSSYLNTTGLLTDPPPNAPERNFGVKTIDGIIWYKKIKLISTDASADLGSMRLHLGKASNPSLSSNTLGRRYFTDLRFEKINTVFNSPEFQSYINNFLGGNS